MTSKRFLGVVSISALIAGAACSDSRSITTEHVGDLGFGINLTKQSTNIAPGFIRIPPSPVATAAPANDSVRIRISGIDSLTTGTYTVWFANDSATKWALVTSGDLIVTQTDSAINAVGDRVVTVNKTTRTGISGWRVGGSNRSLVFNTSRASSNIAATDSLNVVVVSIETGPPGAAPSETRSIWLRRSEKLSATADSGQIRFGNFKPRVADQLRFTQNSVMAINPRGRLEVRGPIFVVNDSNYYRPPIGYYYAGYLIKLDSLNKVVDTLYMGRRSTPYPGYISLYNADKTNPDPTNVFDNPPVVYAMGSRISGDTITKAQSAGNLFWRDFGILNITLESRFAPEGRMGPAIVMTALLPGSIRGR
ncbi:MAG: hypothetical protein ABJC26_16490 [Gemmatimonadaceae bacterium]